MDQDQLKILADNVCIMKVAKKLSTMEIYKSLSAKDLAIALIIYRVYVQFSKIKVMIGYVITRGNHITPCQQRLTYY